MLQNHIHDTNEANIFFLSNLYLTFHIFFKLSRVGKRLVLHSESSQVACFLDILNGTTICSRVNNLRVLDA